MKRPLLLAMLLSAASLMAQVTTYDYGYRAEGITLQDTMYYSQIQTAVISGFSNSKHTGTHYALLQMPAYVSNTFAGCQITSISFCPFITSMTSARIIISETIGGTPLYEQEVTGIESHTWSNATLDVPFSIPSDRELYIGYQIESAAGDYPIGYYYTSNIGENATIDPILDYIAYNENETIKSGLLDVQMWSARRQTANLMLYATISNPDGLPQNAVSIGDVSLTGDVYLKPDEEATVKGLFYNSGISTLNSYHLTITSNGETVADHEVTDVNIQPMEESSFSLNVPTDVIGLHEMTFTITAPNGEENAYHGDETQQCNYLVYDQSAQRNILLEHFTTGNCINCVKGEELVEKELALVPEGINVIRLNHHAGFGSDKLTTTDDTAYEWFYNGTIWAPANMIDRTDLEAFGAVGYGGTATVGPIFGTDRSPAIHTLITAAATLPSFIGLSVSSSVDADRNLTITVDANQLYKLPHQELLRLNVILVEDSVKAAQKLADGSIDKNFIHYDVQRQALTGTWGIEPEVDSNLQYHGEFTYSVPTKYNLEHLSVLVFMADYDPTDPKNCRVHNVVRAPIGREATGISHCQEEEGRTSSRLYNLFGQPVPDNYKGIIIRTK